MSQFPVPVLVVSKCLSLAACRYDGEVIQDDFVARLHGLARLVAVCPEMEIGLGVPRDKIRLVGAGPQRRLVQPASRRDLTETMKVFAVGFLSRLDGDGIDGVILKSRSPSCGLDDCKVFEDGVTEKVIGRGQGVFAEVMAGRWPGVPVADENRLAVALVRRDFLTRVFDRARRREGRGSERDSRPPFPPELMET